LPSMEKSLERVVFFLSLTCALALAPGFSARAKARAAAQDPNAGGQDSQGQSVADAARQSREQKKNAKTKVISNDDLDAGSFKAGQEGLNIGGPATLQTTAAPESQVSATVAADAAASPKAVEERALKSGESDEMAKLQEKIDAAQNELNLLKDENQLDQNTIYSNPNYTDTHKGQDKLDAERARIKVKQQEVDDLKAQLAELKLHPKQTKPSESKAPQP